MFEIVWFGRLSTGFLWNKITWSALMFQILDKMFRHFISEFVKIQYSLKWLTAYTFGSEQLIKKLIAYHAFQNYKILTQNKII